MIQSVVEEQDPLLCAASMFQKLKAEGADELLAELEETELSGN
jgi:hypothetical protein